MKPNPNETGPKAKNYEGKSRDYILKDMFKSDSSMKIEELMQIIDARGEDITATNQTIKFSALTTVGVYKPELFGEMTSDNISKMMRERKVYEEAQKKAYTAHMNLHLSHSVYLGVQDKFSMQLTKLASRKFDFKFVDQYLKLYTVNLNGQDFELLGLFGIMPPECSCYYTPHLIHKKSDFLNVYGSYAVQRMKVLQILKNKKGASKDDQDKVARQASAMMDILLSVSQNKIPVQRVQGPKFLENFSNEERAKTNFPKVLVVMNKILTPQGTRFSYQTILNLVDKLSSLDVFEGKHFIFKDETRASVWCKEGGDLGKDDRVTHSIVQTSTKVNASKASYTSDLNLEAAQVMVEMTQFMDSQKTEIVRVIGKREDQSQKSKKEKEVYLDQKKRDGTETNSLMSVAMEIKDSEAGINSYKHILANYDKWNPKVGHDNLVLSIKFPLNNGRGLINVIGKGLVTSEKDEVAKKDIPDSFHFVKFGELTLPTMFKCGEDYCYLDGETIRKFADSQKPAIDEILDILEVVGEEVQDEEEQILPDKDE